MWIIIECELRGVCSITVSESIQLSTPICLVLLHFKTVWTGVDLNCLT